LVVAFITCEEGWRSWKGKRGLSHFLTQAKRRLTRSVLSNFTGQALAVASGESGLCLVSIPTRLLWARYDVAHAFGQRMDSALARFRSLAASFAAGPAKRVDCLAQARLNELVAMSNRSLSQGLLESHCAGQRRYLALDTLNLAAAVHLWLYNLRTGTMHSQKS
jgi:hypothetical protein